MKYDSPKFRLFIAISIILQYVIFFIINESTNRWDSNESLAFFIFSSPIWLFWVAVWIWQDKFKTFFNSSSRTQDKIEKRKIISLSNQKKSETFFSNANSIFDEGKKEATSSARIIEEIQTYKRKKFTTLKRWILFLLFTFISAIILNYFDPRNIDLFKGETMKPFAHTLGTFSGLIIIPIIIALITRLVRKQSTPLGFFTTFYILIFVWMLITVYTYFGLFSYLKINPLDVLFDSYHIGFLLSSLFVTVLFFGVIYRVIKVEEKNFKKRWSQEKNS